MIKTRTAQRAFTMGAFVAPGRPKLKKETPEELEAKQEKKREQGRRLAATVNAQRWDPDHCQRGHKWTPENIYIASDGGRRCRTCRADSRKRYKIQQRNLNGTN